MLDHPITQKALATVFAATVLAVGGSAWTTGVKVRDHDSKIQAVERVQSESISDLTDELKGLRTDVSEIKTNVAVLKERTEHYDEVHSGKSRP